VKKAIASLLLLFLAFPLIDSGFDEADADDLADPSVSAVYGDDNRHELFEVQNPKAPEIARSVVMLATRENVAPAGGGKFHLKGEIYGESLRLCDGEPYWSQQRIGFCSGVLVAPDTVLTAGHCVLSDIDCADTRIVFDASYREPGHFQYTVPSSHVRNCHRIIRRMNKKSGLDFALIQLNKPVRGREPVKFAEALDPATVRLFMIGHPLGLPAKFSGPARIFKETELEWLTDLDASVGNSGSPVFNWNTGELIGILTAGEDEDFQAPPNTCHSTKFCTTETCNGEVVLKIPAIRDAAGI
jgi:V8-like Glu-specific endopeptidase